MQLLFNSSTNLPSKANNSIMRNQMEIQTHPSLSVLYDINDIDKSKKRFNFILPYMNHSPTSCQMILILFINTYITHLSQNQNKPISKYTKLYSVSPDHATSAWKTFPWIKGVHQYLLKSFWLQLAKGDMDEPLFSLNFIHL